MAEWRVGEGVGRGRGVEVMIVWGDEGFCRGADRGGCLERGKRARRCATGLGRGDCLGVRPSRRPVKAVERL